MKFEKKKFIISPDQAVRQKELFNFEKFGLLKFFCVISHLKKNTFFTFYCKASKIPSKIFLFCKYSCGLESRDNIRKGKAPVVPLRNRCRTLYQNLNSKFFFLKLYIYEFFNIHSEFININIFYIVYKIYKMDFNIQSLISQDFNLKLKSKDSNVEKEIFVLKSFDLKFPHNGCRPRKVRRLKKNRK